MGDETAAPARKGGGLTRAARSCGAGASSPACARATPMTKSPARSSLRRSGSARSAGGARPAHRRDETDHAKLQLARLAQAMQIASVAVADGDVKAIPALLKVIDRVDRYQRAAKVSQVYDDEARRGSWTRSTASPPISASTSRGRRSRGRLRDRIRRQRPGKRRRTKKWLGGSAQAFEKVRFGKGNPRISSAQIWPGFAGYGSNFARFGFSLEPRREIGGEG